MTKKPDTTSAAARAAAKRVASAARATAKSTQAAARAVKNTQTSRTTNK